MVAGKPGRGGGRVRARRRRSPGGAPAKHARGGGGVRAGRGQSPGGARLECGELGREPWEARLLAPESSADLPAMLRALGSVAAATWTVLHPRTLLLGAVAFLFFADFLKRRHRRNYPPGPPSLPIFGNFFQLDFKQNHLEFQRVGEGKCAWQGPDIDLHKGHPGRGWEDGWLFR